MLNELKIGDLMTRHVISIHPDAAVAEAHSVMKAFGIRHLPVLASGCLVGIISSGDIRQAAPSDVSALSVWEMRYLWDRVRVKDIMTRDVITVEEDEPLVNALRLMVAHHFNSMPVVKEGMLAGILTEIDILSRMITLAQSELLCR